MKKILVLALLLTIGVVAGCGSGKKVGSRSITGAMQTTAAISNPSAGITVTKPTTTTISNVKTGTRVICSEPDAKVAPPGQGDSVTVTVPPPGQGVNANAGQATITPSGTGPSSSASLQLTHLLNGSVAVSCRR